MKLLSHEYSRVTVHRLPVEENVTDARVEFLVFRHLCICHQVDRLKSLAPCFIFGEHEQLSPDTSTLN